MDTVILNPHRDHSLKRRHPWVFSGAVNRVEGEPAPGATVDVRAADGKWLGRGARSAACVPVGVKRFTRGHTGN